MICFWSFLTLFPSQFLPWTSLFFVSIVYILFNFYSTPSDFSSVLSPILVGSLAQRQEFKGTEFLCFFFLYFALDPSGFSTLGVVNTLVSFRCSQVGTQCFPVSTWVIDVLYSRPLHFQWLHFSICFFFKNADTGKF